MACRYARVLGRAASTISRELKHNALDSGVYRPHVAEDGARMLRLQRASVFETDAKLAADVTDRLSEGWTPEQVTGRLRLGIKPGLRVVCAETSYGWICRAGQKAGRPWRFLTRHHDRRLKRHGRATRDKIAAMMATFRRLDPRMRGSVTVDNDTCYARHMLQRSMLSATTYLCDACAGWQKGGVENANGRIRRWLPRGTDLDELGEEDIQEIAMTINLTPRICFGYRSPVEAFLSDRRRSPGRSFQPTRWPNSSGSGRSLPTTNPSSSLRRRGTGWFRRHSSATQRPTASLPNRTGFRSRSGMPISW